MWKKLNDTMVKHRFPKPNFKGFMANSAKQIEMLSQSFMVFGDVSVKIVEYVF
jgi:hypothetical protein